MKNKWDIWYNNLPAHTRAYLDQQAVWRDSDVVMAVAFGFGLGLLIGLVI